MIVHDYFECKDKVENLFQCECELSPYTQSSLYLTLSYNSETDYQDWSKLIDLKKLRDLVSILKYDNIKLVGSQISFDSDCYTHSFEMICENQDDL